MTTARTTDLAATADRYLTALNEADPATRRRLIGEAWTPEGSLLDPPLAGQGYDGLAEVGDQLHAGYPGHRFTRTSEVDGHHDRIRFSWALLDPAGEPV